GSVFPLPHQFGKSRHHHRHWISCRGYRGMDKQKVLKGFWSATSYKFTDYIQRLSALLLHHQAAQRTGYTRGCFGLVWSSRLAADIADGYEHGDVVPGG